jgi:hypothetical protein
MQCTFGMAPSSLVVLPTNKVTTNAVPDANIMPRGMCQSPENPTVVAATVLVFHHTRRSCHLHPGYLLI